MKLLVLASKLIRSTTLMCFSAFKRYKRGNCRQNCCIFLSFFFAFYFLIQFIDRTCVLLFSIMDAVLSDYLSLKKKCEFKNKNFYIRTYSLFYDIISYLYTHNTLLKIRKIKKSYLQNRFLNFHIIFY